MNLFYPVDMKWPITQKFGEHPENYPSRNGHPGVDFGCRVNSDLFACMDGTVIKAGYRKEGGYGREIFIQSGNWIFIYGHCLDVHVSVNEKVKRGQIIGSSGGDLADPLRGMSTGPHLHFEMRDTTKPQIPPLIGAIDPMPYLVGSVEITPYVPDVALVNPPEKLDNVTVITNDLHIRALPNDNNETNPPLGHLEYGAKLPVTGKKSGQWHQVTGWVNDGGGKYLE